MNAREQWKNQHWGGKARDLSGTRRGMPGLLGGGWRCTRVPCAPQWLAWCHRECVFVGWQGFNPCCSYSWNATGASLCRFSRCCLQLFMGAPGPCSDSQPQTTLETCTVFFDIVPSLSIAPSPTCPTFFVICMFVSAYSHFTYNSCLSYFLPVLSNTTSS